MGFIGHGLTPVNKTLYRIVTMCPMAKNEKPKKAKLNPLFFTIIANGYNKTAFP